MSGPNGIGVRRCLRCGLLFPLDHGTSAMLTCLPCAHLPSSRFCIVCLKEKPFDAFLMKQSANCRDCTRKSPSEEKQNG